MCEKGVKWGKSLHFPEQMYRKREKANNQRETFELPFEGKLCEENRWIIMSKLIPWSEFEEEYAQNFSSEMGAPAKPFRMALGALIIKDKLGISDREVVEQIKENPYLQYFIGQECYSNEAPFEASMMVHFRQRIEINLIEKVNKKMIKEAREEKEESAEKKSEKEEESKKPITYRKIARKEYLKVAKRRKVSRKERRKAVKKQLQYIQRNLGNIEKLIEKGVSLEILSKRQYRRFLVGNEIYRQQKWMWENKTEKIENRIVNLTQPHIRPIVRGKAGADVEFGAKISASCFDGYLFFDKISWDNFNESGDLKAQVEAYKEFTGHYPESVHVDKIYRTKANRAWCKEREIRISGVPLGRPPKNVSKEAKKQAREDERIRNRIEGKFGQGKRRFSLDRVMAKLSNTSETTIAITFLVMNLVTLLRQVFCQFFWNLIFWERFITSLYRGRYSPQPKIMISHI